VAANCNFCRHAWRTGLTEHLGYFSDRWLAFGWFDNNAGHHHLARTGAGGILQRDHYVLVDTRVIRHHQCDAIFFYITPDDTVIGTLQHIRDHAFAAPLAVSTGHACQHPVTVQHLAHLARGDIQVRAAIIRDHKTKTITMGADTSLYQVHSGR